MRFKLNTFLSVVLILAKSNVHVSIPKLYALNLTATVKDFPHHRSREYPSTPQEVSQEAANGHNYSHGEMRESRQYSTLKVKSVLVYVAG